MHIGIVSELQEQPPLMAGGIADIELIAEFAAADEVEYLAAALVELGHEVTVIGDMAALVRFLGCGGSVDLVFNYAAGIWGRAREAQVPALLEALRVPCTGADAFALTICIDKAIVKGLWRDAGLPTLPFRLIDDVAGLAGVAGELGGFPLFVKPAREGSSKGISSRSVVHSEAALTEQAALLLASYQPLLVEAYLPGREFSVGVLGSGPAAQALGVVEIMHSAVSLVDVLGKKAWTPQTFQPVADDVLRSELCELGLQAYQSVGCRAIGRVDIRMDRAGKPQLLEINPNPGLHVTRSAMPAVARLAGLSYADLLARIVRQAIIDPALERPVQQETRRLAIAANVYLASKPGIGLGVYAQRPFKRGDFLFSATGQVTPVQTMYSLQIDWDKHLDAYPPARYLNHSCQPNAGVKTNSQGLPDFYALRDLAKDEEVRYDYAMTEYRHYERSRPELDFDLTCRCGAPGCRGRFGYYAELTPELKQSYRGFISRYLVNSESAAVAAVE